jgi:hypothetical protein
LRFFGNAKLPHNEFVNFQAPDSGAPNYEPSDGERTDSQRADRGCA